MAINFPSSPTSGDTYTTAGVTWTWDGTTWKAVAASNSETDPVFSASEAATITSTDTTNWDAAYGWGNHATQGYLTSETSHADVVVDGDFTSNGLMSRTGPGTYTTVLDNSGNWDTAYGWGNHANAGYLSSLGSVGGHTDVTITTPLTNQTLVYNGSQWVNQAPSSGLQSRTTSNTSTGSIANDASANVTLGAAKSFFLLKVETSAAAWVTFYTDTSSRSSDATRAENTDPLPGSGVLAEVITTGAVTQILTPGTVGWNNDGTPSTNLYAKVVNKSGSTANITVTITYVPLEV